MKSTNNNGKNEKGPREITHRLSLRFYIEGTGNLITKAAEKLGFENVNAYATNLLLKNAKRVNSEQPRTRFYLKYLNIPLIIFSLGLCILNSIPMNYPIFLASILLFVYLIYTRMAVVSNILVGELFESSIEEKAKREYKVSLKRFVGLKKDDVEELVFIMVVFSIICILMAVPSVLLMDLHGLTEMVISFLVLVWGFNSCIILIIAFFAHDTIVNNKTVSALERFEGQSKLPREEIFAMVNDAISKDSELTLLCALSTLSVNA